MGFFDTPRPRVFGHRGASGVAPENTLASFAAAIAAGASILEMDVHASSDGEIVVIHDPTLERTTDGRGFVRECALAQLRKLDAGYRFVDAAGRHVFRGKGLRIPTLHEVVEAFPESAYNIEIKQERPSIETTVVDLLAAGAALERTLLAAEEHAIMERIRRVAPRGSITGFSRVEVADFLTRCAAGDFEGYQPAGAALQVPPAYEGMEIVTPQTIAGAHRHGLEVHVWTINEESEMERLLDLGVDGIMSDFPERLVKTIARRR